MTSLASCCSDHRRGTATGVLHAWHGLHAQLERGIDSTSYNVRRTDTGASASAIIAGIANTNVGIAAPTSSQTLQCAVQACNANGCSGFTNAPNTTYTDRAGAPHIAAPPAQGLEGVR